MCQLSTCFPEGQELMSQTGSASSRLKERSCQGALLPLHHDAAGRSLHHDAAGTTPAISGTSSCLKRCHWHLQHPPSARAPQLLDLRLPLLHTTNLATSALLCQRQSLGTSIITALSHTHTTTGPAPPSPPLTSPHPPSAPCRWAQCQAPGRSRCEARGPGGALQELLTLRWMVAPAVQLQQGLLLLLGTPARTMELGSARCRQQGCAGHRQSMHICMIAQVLFCWSHGQHAGV